MVLNHSPSKDDLKGAAKPDPENTEDESEGEVANIVYPSAKLGHTTRYRNKILNLLQERNPTNISQVSVLLEKYKQKVDTFHEACAIELQRRDVSVEAKLDFKNWLDQHMKVASGFSDTTVQWLKGEPESKSSSSKQQNSNTNTTPNPVPNPGSLEPSLADILQKQNDITMLLAQNQARTMLPISEPKPFDGKNPLEYKQFVLSFERTIESRTTDSADRYYSLIKYTSGEAQNLVLSCDHEDVDVAYDKARLMLKKQYGNEYVIANHYLLKLENWKEIRSEDAGSLSELSLFLTKCESLMGNMNSLNQLNSLKEIRDIVKKLPVELRTKFRDLVARKTDNEEQVMFRDLVEFVAKHSRILQVPLFGDIVQRKKKKSFHVGTEEKSKKRLPCPCCKKINHWLDNCYFFNKKTLEQRSDIVKKNKFCRSCLKTSSHSSENCENPLTCKKCQGTHPTSLHRETKSTPSEKDQTPATNPKKGDDPKNPPEKKDPDPVSSHHVTVRKNARLVYPSVLVNIKIPGRKRQVRTYLGMDPYSSSSFIDANIIGELGSELSLERSEFALTTMHETDVPTKMLKIPKIEVISLDGNNKTILSGVLAKENWPFTTNDSPCQSDMAGFPQFEDLPISFEGTTIGLLVGMDRPDIVKPLEIVHTTKRGPYATKHMFGWCLNGPFSCQKPFHSSCFFGKVKEHDLNEKFEAVFASDFESESNDLAMSFEDRLWTKKVESTIERRSDGHFQIGLPFKNENVLMPNNYDQAKYRMARLHDKFEKKPEYFEAYNTFMKTMLENGHAEQIPEEEVETIDGKNFYLIHFSVEHKQKKKIRIVFDCSLKYAGLSLNDVLLQGPDLANNLVGVLLRFRQDEIAFSADIKSMFYQVGVPKHDADYMRFLWYPNGDITKKPVPHRILVHVFGARSSPSCANYALKHVAEVESTNISKPAKTTLKKAFYVDDLLKSSPDEIKAMKIAHEVSHLLRKNGFELVGFVSNSRRLLESFPKEILSKTVKELDLKHDELPYDRALGMVWNTQEDNISYKVNLKPHPRTKRGILSTLFSIYDPLFLVAPAVLTGKRMFQELCSRKIGWDEPLDQKTLSEWDRWTEDLPLLSRYEIPRCLIPSRTENTTLQMHTFCDGSMTGYGAVSYLRVKTEDGSTEVKVRIIMAKSRLTPLNRGALKTVPRIELNSAKLAVMLWSQIMSELDVEIDQSYFWSDSTTVLNYVKSESGRFKTFVANRVDFIRSKTKIEQWRHVPSEDNAADILSRGSKSIGRFVGDDSWKYGPSFLSKNENEWPSSTVIKQDPLNNEEMKKISACVVQTKESPTSKLLNSVSNWDKLVLRVGVFLSLKDHFHTKRDLTPLTRSDFDRSELEIWRFVQQNHMKETYNTLKNKRCLNKRDHLQKLTPFIDECGIMRVGGRLENSPLSYSQKHPILLPKNNVLVERYCLKLHKEIGHCGREYLLSELRQKLYVVGATTLAKRISKQCIICRKLNGKPVQQEMASLPYDRVAADSPIFSNTGVDCFGPYSVSRGRGRTTEKRYGILFTCLTSRAMHIEIAHSLDVDSFINALKRFTARRGPVKLMRSDCGTNFVAGEKELKDSVEQWNKDKIDLWCKSKHIEWKFNPPSAPHHGGCWEREIRSLKKVLNALCSEFSGKLKMTDELLLTFMCEVENILNNRPLTSLTDDPSDPEPLTPNHLLRLKSDDYLPDGVYDAKDIFHRRKWRQVQHMAENFWIRYRREYLPLLIHRQKWLFPRRNLQKGDFVLVVDQNLPRSLWCTGRVEDVRRDGNDMVRSVLVIVSKCKEKDGTKFGTTTLERPISKLILLRTKEELS